MLKKQKKSSEKETSRVKLLSLDKKQFELLLEKGNMISKKAEEKFRSVRQVSEEDMRLLLN